MEWKLIKISEKPKIDKYSRMNVKKNNLIFTYIFSQINAVGTSKQEKLCDILSRMGLLQ